MTLLEWWLLSRGRPTIGFHRDLRAMNFATIESGHISSFVKSAIMLG